MAFDTFKANLELKELNKPTKEHEKLLCFAKGCIDKSRKDMSKNYSRWDELDMQFRSERKQDKEDRVAQSKGQPGKMIVPLVHAQIMTFVAFCVSTVTQNPRFYELEPTGTEDNPLREPMELILERDTRRNQWSAFLVQFFLDIGRFCLGAAEVCYVEESRMIRVPQTTMTKGAFGDEQQKTTVGFQAIPTFLGNKVYPVSPYNIFPDTSLPLTRFQEGEFCGSEEMWSLSRLKGAAASLGLFNLDKIPKFTQDQLNERHKVSRIDNVEPRKNPNMGSSGDSGMELGDKDYVTSGPVVITKLCVDITPKHFTVADGENLGDEDFPIRYIVWYANDQTIIRFEEAYYLHGQFPYVIGQFLPDQHKLVNDSLADLCAPISGVITWLINAHVTSIRSTIDGKFIIDPAGVDVKQLESRSPYIFLKPAASQSGVDQYIKQFEVQDVTSAFMGDANALKDLLEAMSGFSGIMQGQHSQGRRSATQDRVVAQSGAVRGKTTLSTIWDSSFEPLGKQLIANNRQEMDFETFARIVGQGPHAMNIQTGAPYTTEELYSLFHTDPISIATSEDFFVFDGTLPSEKSFLAQSLQEILMQMLSNPQISMMLGYGPQHFKQLFDDIYNLRGVTNSRMPAPQPMPMLPGPQGGPEGSPENVVPGPGVAPSPAMS